MDRHYPGAVKTITDRTFGMERIEIVCSGCGGHLGHVFKGERFTATVSPLSSAPTYDTTDHSAAERATLCQLRFGQIQRLYASHLPQGLIVACIHRLDQLSSSPIDAYDFDGLTKLPLFYDFCNFPFFDTLSRATFRSDASRAVLCQRLL